MLLVHDPSFQPKFNLVAWSKGIRAAQTTRTHVYRFCTGVPATMLLATASTPFGNVALALQGKPYNYQQMKVEFNQLKDEVLDIK
ncbi:Uncharacterized protein TCM_044227 [Theobroma cacao]|uniref:Uncharacterized protein n=1 Tax=Theobroma cacao TaxID=3641 RepID=A0A061FWS4_THECC|nr:Uncharacterized protein TCM_044227 [Theobroma cacao]